MNLFELNRTEFYLRKHLFHFVEKIQRFKFGMNKYNYFPPTNEKERISIALLSQIIRYDINRVI